MSSGDTTADEAARNHDRATTEAAAKSGFDLVPIYPSGDCFFEAVLLRV